jgi:hypothetical protein
MERLEFQEISCHCSGLSKKLDAVANKKGCQDVRDWVHSIINHMYWSASTSSSGEETAAKWTSVANHIQNVHVHDNWHFPSCAHGPIDSSEHKKWLLPSMHDTLLTHAL